MSPTPPSSPPTSAPPTTSTSAVTPPTTTRSATVTDVAGDLDHDTMLAELEACTLPNFSHRDHVRAAWLYLRRRPFLEAIESFGTTLRAYAASKGADGLYHETITWAFFLLIRQRLEVSENPDDWATFEAENPDLLSNQPSVLERYYRPATLDSPLARRIFVLPDRAAG